MPFSRILNRVLSYTEYGPEYHIDNQKVTKRPAVVDKIQQNDKTSLCLWYSNESNAEQYYTINTMMFCRFVGLDRKSVV